MMLWTGGGSRADTSLMQVSLCSGGSFAFLLICVSLQPGRASALAVEEETTRPEQLIPCCLCYAPGKREIN